MTNRKADGAPALVLVHGGSHDARCWRPTIDELGELAPGLPAVAIDLPGRGRCTTPLEDMTVSTCVDAVVRQVDEAGVGDVILVGHSMAGAIIPQVSIALGTRCQGLVYVACSVPAQGTTILRSVSWPIALLARIGARVTPSDRVIAWPVARAMFCNGMTRAQRDLVKDVLVPESPAMPRERVDRTGLDPGIRQVWIRTLRDRAVRRRQQARSMATAGVIERIDIDGPHDVMVSHPQELARILVDIAIGAGRPRQAEASPAGRAGASPPSIHRGRSHPSAPT